MEIQCHLDSTDKNRQQRDSITTAVSRRLLRRTFEHQKQTRRHWEGLQAFTSLSRIAINNTRIKMMKMSRISLKSNKSNRSVRSSHYEPDEPSVFSLMSSSGSKKEPKSDKKEVSKSNASSGHKGSIKRLNMSASKTAYGKSSQSSSCHMKFLFDPNGRFSDWISK